MAERLPAVVLDWSRVYAGGFQSQLKADAGGLDFGGNHFRRVFSEGKWMTKTGYPVDFSFPCVEGSQHAHS